MKLLSSISKERSIIVCVRSFYYKNSVQFLVAEKASRQRARWQAKIVSQQKRKVEIPAYQRTNIPAFFTLPQKEGGYLILSEFEKEGSTEVLKSRRYIKVGQVGKVDFWEVEP